MKYNTITILDFETGYTHIITISEELKNKQAEEIVEALGFRESDCHYMITREVITGQKYCSKCKHLISGACEVCK